MTDSTLRHALIHSINISVSDLRLWADYPLEKLEAMTTDELQELEQRLGTQWDLRFHR